MAPEVRIPVPAQDSQTSVALPISPPTVATRRSGMMFCVVGDGLASAELFRKNFCDYIVYPDLVAQGGEFVPLLGKVSWNVFQAGAKVNRDVGLGLSFSAVGIGQHGSTLDSLPSMATQLAGFVQTMNVTAMGVLNFPRHLGTKANTLAPAFQAFANAVSQQRHTEPMTFLGVWLYKEATAREFASEVATMTHINTIIIQTHISVPFRAGHTCISRPICAMAASDLRPSFEVAQQAESFLRSRGDKFRIVFSSTLGVMVYVGQAFRKQPSGPYDACDSSYMAGRDFLCSGGTTSLGLEMYDKDEMYTYVIYQDGSNQHFVTYETTNSLLDKMNLYIETISDGWALFEAHRDSAQGCAIQEHYQRLEMVQFNARNRSRNSLR
ncbi:uncharacterized protein LOC119456930 [Dermacentor silvarum]|uniref:uncharacterized protein LOC119456930 n=1 Tax=Dermacentor silvarum TaxID=543639 RepID=UPI00210199EA|nr:uncharacterized protein LOC119456930 [Dermacentor silvarum]